MHGSEGVIIGKVPLGALPQHVSRGVGMALATLAAQWISLVLWDHALNSQIIWLPGPLLLALLVSRHYRYGAAYNIGWLAGMLSLVAMAGAYAWGMAVICLSVLVLINLAALSLIRVRREQRGDNFAQLLLFLVVAVVALSAATGMVVSSMANALHLPPWLGRAWWQTGLACALGYALLTPAMVSLLTPAAVSRRDTRPRWHVHAVTLCALLLLWLAWRELAGISTLRPLLLLAPVPLAIFVVLRVQVVGTSVVNLLVGLIAIQLSLAGEGPFVQAESEMTTISVQLWMLGVSVASLYLAVLVEQRRVTQRALAASSGEVRELAGRLIVAQEQERARIARDLHDDINQRLAVASIRLSALRRKVDERNRQDVSQLQSELIALSEDVRHLSHDLHPSMLTQTGLTAALAALCQNLRKRHGPDIDLLVSPHAKDLPEDVALCIYRVVQEGLGNAIRHASARRIEVALQVRHDDVTLTIADNGKGFAVDDQGHRGLGLMSIDERTKLLNGSYQLQSMPGRGTELCIRIPLSTHEPA